MRGTSTLAEVIGIGEAMVELWSRGPLGEARVLNRAYGGDVLNTLVMLARLGRRTAFLSRVGNDPFGPGLVDAWRAEGIDTTLSPLTQGDNGVYFISRSSGGEREFTYRRRGSAASRLTPADLPVEALGSAQALLVSGITQALSTSCQHTVLEAARMAREKGVLVAFDPNYRPRLWADRAEATGAASERALELARGAFTELLPHVDLLLLSDPGDTPLLPPVREGAADATAIANALGVPHVALKRGSQGAEVHLFNQWARSEAPAVARVRDTTGAGDAWNAGLLHSVLAGAPAEKALRNATSVAGWKVGRYGAVPPADTPLRELVAKVNRELTISSS